MDRCGWVCLVWCGVSGYVVGWFLRRFRGVCVASSASVGGGLDAPQHPSTRTDEAGLVRVVHPSVDEFGDGFAVFASASRVVGLTGPLASFLGDVSGFGVRPVLMTRTDAVLSVHVALTMRRLGGFWAVQAADGVTFDALTGRRIGEVGDLWNPAAPEAACAPRFVVPVERGLSSVRVLGFDVCVEHRARPSTRVGPLVQMVVEALGGGRLDWWGSREPLTRAWGEVAVTELVQSQMPRSQTVLAGNASGGFAQVRVSRTASGLLEHATGGVVAPPGASTAVLLEVASGALEQVAARFRVVTALVSLAEYDSVPGLAPGLASVVGGAGVGVRQVVRGVWGYAPEVPLVVVLGARAVHDMGVDVTELSGRFDVWPVGPGRRRGLLVRLSGEGGLWGQFAAFARQVLPRAATGRTA